MNNERLDIIPVTPEKLEKTYGILPKGAPGSPSTDTIQQSDNPKTPDAKTVVANIDEGKPASSIPPKGASGSPSTDTIQQSVKPKTPDAKTVIANIDERKPASNSLAKGPESKSAQVQSKKVITIPNGMVDRPYDYRLKNEDISEKPSSVRVSGLESTGLTFDASQMKIIGTPTVSGEIKCKVEFNRILTVEQELQFTINPDPKSLWKDIPSDQKDPYAKPDFCSECISTKTLKMIAASQRGRSHAHEGKFRDDAFAFKYMSPDDWYVLVVADGAGSAKFSRKGSDLACQNSLSFLEKNISLIFTSDVVGVIHSQFTEPSEVKNKSIINALYTVLGGAAHAAYKAVEEEVKTNGSHRKDYATTLITAIAKKYSFGWFIASYWVGDGGVGIYKSKEWVKILGEPDGGEFAGQTRFLTSSEVWDPQEICKRLRFEIVPDFTALILMTDGITDPKFQTDNNLKKLEKWDELWADLAASTNFDKNAVDSDKQLLSWLDFWSAGNHDDRTLAILY